MTIGTIGTPACIARWKAPFLNGASFGVSVRVPSGEMQIDLPSCLIASTSGSIALIALLPSARSTKTVPPHSISLPRMGMSLISFLPTPPMSRRMSLARIITSALLW